MCCHYYNKYFAHNHRGRLMLIWVMMIRPVTSKLTWVHDHKPCTAFAINTDVPKLDTPVHSWFCMCAYKLTSNMCMRMPQPHPSPTARSKVHSLYLNYKLTGVKVTDRELGRGSYASIQKLDWNVLVGRSRDPWLQDLKEELTRRKKSTSTLPFPTLGSTSVI